MNEWITTTEIAKELEVTTQTVRNLLKKENVPMRQLGQRFRIRRTDFEALMKRREKN